MTDLAIIATDAPRTSERPDRLDGLALRSARLLARDPDALAAFYARALDLTVETRDDARIVRRGDEPMLEIARTDAPRAASRAPGLYHLAFLTPDRGALAAWLRRLPELTAEFGVELWGASDHGVSEALYLSDPEGNGIEIYADRDPRDWPRAPDGALKMTRERLDLAALAAGAPERAFLGSELRLGHAHLHVGDLAAARRFYAETLGLEEMVAGDDVVFYGADGYHHHLATNTWGVAGQPPRAADAPGLAELRLSAAPSAIRAAVERLALSDRPFAETADGVVAIDPSGVRVQLAAREAR